jgi:hypothetical protein
LFEGSSNLFSLFGNTERGGLAVSTHGIQIALPLSPTLLLSFVCERLTDYLRERLDRLHWLRGFVGFIPKPFEEAEEVISPMLKHQMLSVRPENVEHYNSLQVIQSSRFVFSAAGDFSLVRSMLSEHPTLKHPHAMRPENEVEILSGKPIGEIGLKFEAL